MARARYIIVLGPDGSGKTTVADQLAHTLDIEGHSVTRLNFSFGILPSISTMLRRTSRSQKPEGTRNAGMVKPLSVSRASLLACWYGLDHMLGHVYLKFCPRNEIVIFARSYHDFLYQRAYINLPRIIPRLFIALGPKPDLLTTPLRDPNVIHVQKPELTDEEIKQQYARISKRMHRYRYFSSVDATRGIKQTVLSLRALLKL
ncbi:hypothetical protein [Pseudovibrio sp. SCP19]|uniref:hypothetical protein n=1 Tax=Pseudovibrio sp. SCP19 TaxID=3141374 RepID=UPI003339E96F